MTPQDAKLLDGVQIAFPAATLEQAQLGIRAVREANYERFTSPSEAVQKTYLKLATVAGTPDYGPFASLKNAKRLLAMMHRDGRLAAAIHGPALAASNRCTAL